jgi:hypothetical protein
MTELMRSPGEVLFEQYLASQGLTDWEFEKEHPFKQKRPDYTVRFGGEYLFDIKEFEPRIPMGDVGCYDPYKRIRSKIDKGSEKFQEFKDWPCNLVLYNDGSAPLVNLEDPSVMFGAMLGDFGISVPFDPETGLADSGAAQRGFLYRGKMRHPRTTQPQNTTISALITLRHVAVGRARLQAHVRELKKHQTVTIEDWFNVKGNFDRTERQLGVIVWENPVARIPLSRELFCGPYDERYGLDGDCLTRVFAGAQIVKLDQSNP